MNRTANGDRWVAGFAMAVAMAMGCSASASTITMDLSGNFSGSLPDSYDVTAAFADQTGGGVLLTMTAVQTSTTYPSQTDYVQNWLFNVDNMSLLGNLNFAQQQNTGSVGVSGITQTADGFRAGYSGNYFSLKFAFANNSFSTGDSVSYLITGGGVTAADFLDLSDTKTTSYFPYSVTYNDDAGSYYSAAYIDCDNAGWLGACSATQTQGGPAPTPDAGYSATLLGLAMLGLGGLSRNLRKV